MLSIGARSLTCGAAATGLVAVLLAPSSSPASGTTASGTAGSAAAASGSTFDPTARKRGGCADRDRVARLLARDMRGKHEGRMHGVPRTYNWAKKPRVGVGNRPGKHNFRAFSVWGQVYESRKGSPARNVRVSVKHIQGWILSRSTGKWRRVVKSKGVFGRNYREDFQGNASIDAPLRREKGGVVSSTLGNGYNFHFFPTKMRRAIDPRDIGGVVTLYSARVIKDDRNGPDDRHRARYLASAGGDYWLDKYVGAAPGTVGPVGVGKARFLSSRWMTVTMSTLPLRKLRANPPRVCLRGR